MEAIIVKATLNSCFVTAWISRNYNNIVLAHQNATSEDIQNADVVLGDFETELDCLGINETPVFYKDELCVMIEKTPENAKMLLEKLQEYYVEKIRLIAAKDDEITGSDARMISVLTMYIELSKDRLTKVINGVEEEEQE